MESKVCFSCKETKAVSLFNKDNNRNSYQRECKECCAARKREWYKTEEGKKSSANTKLKRRFGITLKDYEEMHSKQDGKCLCCGASDSYLGHRLAVDHCHKTGKIRGLLCKACNLALGNVKEDKKILENLMSYIDNYCK